MRATHAAWQRRASRPERTLVTRWLSSAPHPSQLLPPHARERTWRPPWSSACPPPPPPCPSSSVRGRQGLLRESNYNFEYIPSVACGAMRSSAAPAGPSYAAGSLRVLATPHRARLPRHTLSARRGTWTVTRATAAAAEERTSSPDKRRIPELRGDDFRYARRGRTGAAEGPTPDPLRARCGSGHEGGAGVGSGLERVPGAGRYTARAPGRVSTSRFPYMPVSARWWGRPQASAGQTEHADTSGAAGRGPSR